MRPLWLLTATVLLAVPAYAQHDHHAMEQSGDSSPATVESQAVMAKMHEGMDITYTGDADRDFVNGMLPHHEGAVAMAKIQLKYGKDPALKRLAKSIIVSQGKEIRYMKKWRDEHPQGR